MAYEGQDLIDYEAGAEYLPQRYYQQKFQRNITGPEIMGQTSGITSTGAAQPYVFEPPSEQRGDKGGDFGQWGDLDEGSLKMFDKQVWGQLKPGSGQKGWINQPVKGYMNVNTGQYQTEEGKNIEHFGLEVPSIIGAIGNKLTGQKFGEHQVGDIKGKFTKDAELSDEEAADKKRYDDLHKKIRIDNRRKQLASIGALEGNKIFVGGGGTTIEGGRDVPLPPPRDYKQDQGGGLTLGGGFTESESGGRGHHGGPTQTPQSPSDAEGTPFAQGGRIGYNIGQLVRPGPGRPGYKGTTWDEFKRDTSKDAMVRPGDDSWRDVYYRWLDINTFGDDLDLAHGGRVPFFYGGLASIL